MRDATLRLFILTAMVVLGTASCIVGRASPPTQHYVLSPVIEAPSAGTARPAASQAIGIGPVRLPAYLDRPQVVMRPASDRLDVREFAQWGEPLRDAVTRVVTANLARLVPDSRVVPFPWRSAEKIRYQVILDIEQMDGPADGTAVLDARWRVLDRAGSEVASRESRLSEPIGSGTVAAAVSRTLGTLSRDIVRELASL